MQNGKTKCLGSHLDYCHTAKFKTKFMELSELILRSFTWDIQL